MNPDHFDALVEIVDSLCATLAHNPNNKAALDSIAKRARKLYRESLRETYDDDTGC